MIKAITFDVGGTLADGGLDKRAFLSGVLDYLDSLGFRVSPEAYRRSLDDAMRVLRKARESGRELDFFSFYSRVLRGLGIEPSGWVLQGLLELYFRCFAYEIKPGVREVLEELSSEFELGVISNALSSWPRRFLELEGLDRYFKVVVISGEVGWRKPHERIFRTALEQLGVRAGEAVHVGNSPEEDIRGAKRVGMRAVLVLWGRPPEDLDVAPDAIINTISELPGAISRLSEVDCP